MKENKKCIDRERERKRERERERNAMERKKRERRKEWEREKRNACWLDKYYEKQMIEQGRKNAQIRNA